MLHKIIKLITCIVIISTLTNIGLMFIIRARIVNVKIAEQERYIDFYASTTDSNFDTVTSAINFIENSTIPKNAIFYQGHYSNKTANYIKDQEYIINLLSTFSVTSPIISEAFIYSNKNEFLYTNTGLTKLSTYFNNRYLADYESWINILSSTYPEATLIKMDRKPSTNTNYKYEFRPSAFYFIKTMYNANNGICNIVLDITDLFFNETTNSQIKLKEGNYLFILDQNNNILTSTMDKNENIELLTDYKNIEKTTYNPSIGMVSSRNSNINGIYYAVYTSNNALFGNVNEIFLLSIALSLLLMGIMLFTSIRISSKLYCQVKTVMDVFSDIKNNTIYFNNKSGLKNIKTLVLKLATINHTIRKKDNTPEQFFLQMILFKLIKGDTQLNKILIENTSFSKGVYTGYYSVFVIQMDLHPSSEEVFFTEYKNVFYDIINANTGENILGIIETSSDETVIINYYDSLETYENTITKYSEIANELLDAIPNSNFYIGCSSYVREIYQINECYDDAITKIRNRNIKSTDTVINNNTEYGNKSFFPDDFEIKMKNMLVNNQKEMVVKYIKHILDKNYKNDISMSQYLSVCSTINEFLIRNSSNMQRNSLILNHNNYLYSVKRINNIIANNLDIAFSCDNLTDTPIINKIENYVEEHFKECINLAIVAQNLGYTPNYLSKFFKQEKGINFTDYLNRRRIEYSKELLLNTNKSGKDIAIISGFNSYSLFIRTFEKYEGLTPGEFKRLAVSFNNESFKYQVQEDFSKSGEEVEGLT